jgi:hypothetical protein
MEVRKSLANIGESALNSSFIYKKNLVATETRIYIFWKQNLNSIYLTSCSRLGEQFKIDNDFS